MTAIIERQRARFYINTKSQKNAKRFYKQKAGLFFKKLYNFRDIFIHKKPYTLRYGIFHEFLKMAFLYKKYDTLRCVTFLYTKS